MRIIVALLTVLSCSMPVRAGAQDRDESTRSLTKIVIGAGALAIGTAVAAKSSQTTTVSTAVATPETSTFSTSQLATGLAIAGVGGIVLWDGLRSHDSTRRSIMIWAGIGRHVQSVFFRRQW